MAAIPHRTKNGVRHEMSGAGFHTPAKYTKNDRLNKKELNDILEEEMYDFEDETGASLGLGVPDENPELERVKQALFDLRDVFLLNGNEKGVELVYALLDHTREIVEENHGTF